MNAILDRLASPLDVDTFISTFKPLWGSRLQGVIESVTPLTPDSATIRIRPGRPWSGHQPGQFVTVGVDIAGVRHHRCFSLTSTPSRDDRLIEIAVHCGETGFVSRHLIRDARPGDVIQLTQAEGQFVIPPTPANGDGRHRLLFITGGSGITPVMGMLRSLAGMAESASSAGGNGAVGPADVVLLHHARTAEQMMFLPELERLAARSGWFSFAPTFTAEGGQHLDSDRLAGECPDWAERQVHVCGPQAMLDFVESHWASAGLAGRLHNERLVSEFAPRATAHARVDDGGSTSPDGASAGTTRFGRSDLSVTTEAGRPLLEVAEDAGLTPAYGCRMGVCHTCTTRLDEGCVTNLVDGRVSQPGSHVRICVSAALDDVSLDL